MFKRIVIALVLCMGVWALAAGQAMGRVCTLTTSGLKCWGSICSDQFFRAAKEGYTAGCVSIDIKEMYIDCFNNGGNSQTAQGIPFTTDLTVTSAALADAALADSSGKILFRQCWALYNDECDDDYIGDYTSGTCPEILANGTELKLNLPSIYSQLKDEGYLDATDPYYCCQNPNWDVGEPSSLAVKAAVVYFGGYSRLNGNAAECLSKLTPLCQVVVAVPDNTSPCGYVYAETTPQDYCLEYCAHSKDKNCKSICQAEITYECTDSLPGNCNEAIVGLTLPLPLCQE